MASSRRQKERAPVGEITVAGQDIKYKYGSAGENPNKMIASKGMEYLEGIENDSHLASCLQIRRQKLVQKPWSISAHSKDGKVTAKNQDIADFVAWNLEAMVGSFEKDLEGMLDATGKGFSLTEINYRLLTQGPYSGKMGLKSLRFKPAKYFAFKYDNWGHYKINQIDPDPSGQERPLGKYIHIISGFNDENPYGDSLSAKCAFWVWLKRNQAKFWAIFNERFGIPLTKITLPRNLADDEDSKTKARSLISDLATKAGVVVPEGFEVEFLESLRRGDITYDNFIERCNKEISKLILGATLVSEEGKRGQGSYALGSSHADLLENVIVFDVAVLTQAINEQLIKRLVDYNYITDVYPRFAIEGFDISAFISFAQSISILTQNGMKIPINWLYEKTGVPLPRKGEPVLGVPDSGPQGRGGTPNISEPTKVRGTDNRSVDKMLEEVEQFADLPDEILEEIKHLKNLQQRYQGIAGETFEGILKSIENYLKKKSQSLVEPMK